jgi:hypothetical protein
MKIRSAALLAASLLLGSTAANAALVARSTDLVGGLLYTGVGETMPGNGVGSGFYQVGSCSFNGTITTCSSTGSYTETADSTNNPGETGTFLFEQIFPGTVNPITARSQTSGSNNLVLLNLGAGFFRLTLTPSMGAPITGVFPADPFSDSIGFSLFLGRDAGCTGLSMMVVCSIGNVGLNPGSTISGSIGEAFFTIPDSIIPVDPIPVPGAIALFATGAAAFAAAKRRRKP